MEPCDPILTKSICQGRKLTSGKLGTHGLINELWLNNQLVLASSIRNLEALVAGCGDHKKKMNYLQRPAPLVQ